MAVILSKGQKVDLTKNAPNLNAVLVGLGWDVNQSNGPAYDLDASAFLLDETGKVRNEQDFIFYNNPVGANNSVIYSGDNRTGSGQFDDEQIRIQLKSVPEHVHRIALTITIHDAYLKGQNFSQISNAYVRVENEETGEELLRFNLQQFTIETAIVAAEIYRYKNEWKFNAIGSGFQGGLAALCRNFGLEVEESRPEPTTPFNNQQTPMGQTAPPAAHGFPSQPSVGNPLNHGQHQANMANGPITQGYNPYPPPGQHHYGNQPFQHGSRPLGQAVPNRPAYSPQHEQSMRCPRCQSDFITTGKKGFGIGKAAIGGLVFGPVGLLGGFIGANKMEFRCQSCHYRWSLDQTDFAGMFARQKENARRLLEQYSANNQVLDAIMASCALVAMADGYLDPNEKQKVYEFIYQSDELRSFNTNTVISRFDHYVRRLQTDPIAGRAEALRAVGKVKDREDLSRLVVRYGIAIAFADGQLALPEQDAIRDICFELRLNPGEFLS